VKLLDVTVEKLRGIPDGAYSFTELDGSPRGVVVLDGDHAGILLETIAALFEAVREADAPHTRAWWLRRQGPEEARLRARWALSEAEAALAASPGRTAVMEWRFGPGDPLPRQLQAGGASSASACAALARYVHLDANRDAIWMGGPAADPLAKRLTAIVRRDVTATRAVCQPGVGLVALETPDTFATLNRALAALLPTLRLERVRRGRGARSVACFRDDQRVELDQLADAERDAIHIVAALHAARVRDGVVLVDGRELLHGPIQEHARWLGWLAGVAASNQLFVAATSTEPLSVAPHGFVVAGASDPSPTLQANTAGVL
jgi:hypothetical protein